MKNILFVIIILVIISIIFIVYSNIIISEKYIIEDIPVDIVYTWVESNEEFEKEKSYWLKKTNKEDIENIENSGLIRFKDNKEIMYSLRSVEKYFPNYNNIYIIVKDGQFPKYLKKDHPKIKIVNHSDIIPKEYLPTFNSCAIECFIHHIPNLTEYYLYLNDDFMFLKNLKKSYFIKNKELPYILYSNIDYDKKYISKINNIDLNSYDFYESWVYNSKILDKLHKIEKNGRRNYSHIPRMFKKSFNNKIEDILKKYYSENEKIDVYTKTQMSKFRKNYNLALNVLIYPYLYYYLFNCEFKKTNESYIIFDNNNSTKLNTEFLCVNIVQDQTNFGKYMDKIYPEKSSFEI